MPAIFTQNNKQMIKKHFLISLIILIKITLTSTLFAQNLKHPTIWITENERADILKKIKKYEWAKSISDQLHERIDKKNETHKTSPQLILNTIPALGDNMRKHNTVLNIAAEAGMLYFLTKEESYAQLSADIIAYYSEKLHNKTPQTTEIMGSSFHDPRTTYSRIALAYDFAYDFLKSGKAKAYNVSQSKYETFDNAKAQKMFTNIIGNILQEYGKPARKNKVISNHPVLTATGALYTILCIEDDVERERLFNVFWNTGTRHQPAFKNKIIPMFSKQGIWPESLGYSFMPNVSLVLNIVDRIKPELDVTKDAKHILDGNFLFTNLRYPDRRFVRYGDSKRRKDKTKENYRYALSIADRRGYSDIKKKAQLALKQTYVAEKGRKSKITSFPYNNASYLELFWGLPVEQVKDSDIDYKPTVVIEHAGISLQRNHVEKQNRKYGLAGIIGGAHYVHSHLTGITMELYGLGYVMAPNAGLPKSNKDRLIPLHEDYFRLYAGNNTVIVNGTSHGVQRRSWKDKAYVWQNNSVNIASEPKHLEDPLNTNFSFTRQLLEDKINNCDQQRTLSIIRTSPTTGYYFDMFRSKSLDINKFHDYIYHNIGDDTEIRGSKDNILHVIDTDRYNNDIGDPVHSPGWRYFENTMVTKPTQENVNIKFKIDHKKQGCYMNMFMPDGVEREYTKGLAPETREAKNRYYKKKTQVLAVRQKGEAWDRPFIAVLEPSKEKSSSIKKVESLKMGDKIVGAKVLSLLNNRTVTDYIISLDTPNDIYINKDLNFSFQGQFAIVRVEKYIDKIRTKLYIGNGTSLEFNKFKLKANDDNNAYKSFLTKM